MTVVDLLVIVFHVIGSVSWLLFMISALMFYRTSSKRMEKRLREDGLQLYSYKDTQGHAVISCIMALFLKDTCMENRYSYMVDKDEANRVAKPFDRVLAKVCMYSFCIALIYSAVFYIRDHFI